ncbi:uncharacterized protein V6R79_017737 [Siganus canaliculatus]
MSIDWAAVNQGSTVSTITSTHVRAAGCHPHHHYAVTAEGRQDGAGGGAAADTSSGKYQNPVVVLWILDPQSVLGSQPGLFPVTETTSSSAVLESRLKHQTNSS